MPSCRKKIFVRHVSPEFVGLPGYELPSARRVHGNNHMPRLTAYETLPLQEETTISCTHGVVLLEFDLDIGIGFPEEIRVFEVVGLDESNSENAHGEINLVVSIERL